VLVVSIYIYNFNNFNVNNVTDLNVNTTIKLTRVLCLESDERLALAGQVADVAHMPDLNAS